MTELNIAIAGAGGRMGRILIEAVLAAPDARLSGALDVAGAPAVGSDAAAFLGRPAGVAIASELAAGLAGAACLIDFTRPEGTLEHLAYCAEHGIKMVIGTTGFDDAGKAAIAAAAQKTAIVFAPNFSVGVNVTMKLLQQAARALAVGYDIEIVEAHHRHKVDAPSGTALKMGEVIAGAHTVLFAGTGERIEISHKSSSRVTYAHGALRAARFLADKSSGLYDMNDVLALND